MVRVRSATFLYLLLHVSPALPMEVDYRVEPSRLSYLEVRGASAANQVAQQIQRPNSSERSSREEAARELATRYLDLWSDPKQVTAALTSTFYAPVVRFHGRTTTRASVIAEKRRFGKRWPDRRYRHRPETTEVTCDSERARCTVRSSFDFRSENAARRQQSVGLGEHELVVSFEAGRPLIISENSRVIIRGQGNLTPLLVEKPRRAQE